MLVSAIMPTFNRRPWIPRAVELFLSQTLTDSELIVLDSGERIGDLLPGSPRIRYMRADPELTLGQLRNACCEAASGEYIANWDDDDWYHPDRLADQLQAIGDADICGYDRIMFAGEGQEWSYTAPPGVLLGNSLFFRRSFWQRQQFRAMHQCDEPFVAYARGASIVAIDGLYKCCASIHPGNSSPRRPQRPAWERIS